MPLQHRAAASRTRPETTRPEPTVIPGPGSKPPDPRVQRRDLLGGLIHEYEPAAALRSACDTGAR
jgi:hypothetical protein